MDSRFAALKKMNVLAGCLHLASLIAILLLANNASLPVRAIYLTEAPGTGNFSDPIELFSLNGKVNRLRNEERRFRGMIFLVNRDNEEKPR